MKIQVKTTIGRTEYQFHIDEQKDMEALHKAAIFGNPPLLCNVCENRETFKLDSNKDKEGNIYVNVICKCGAKSKLGQYKVGGFFWHKFEVYQPKNQEQPAKQHTPEQVAQELGTIDTEAPF